MKNPNKEGRRLIFFVIDTEHDEKTWDIQQAQSWLRTLLRNDIDRTAQVWAYEKLSELVSDLA